MILLEDVSKIYQLKERTVSAVHNIDLGIEAGEFVIITGRSGSGKTTLLNLVAGLTRPTSGRILVEESEVWRLPDPEQAALRNRRIGFVFQFPSLLPSLNALENVILPTLFAPPDGAPAPAKAEIRERAASLLREVGLGDRLTSLPRQLSAGQQQRVVIARALINEPDLLLADEPTSNLDEHTEREIMDLFRAIHRSRKLTILLVTHTSELVSYGTRALRMADGRIVGPESV